MKTLSVYRPTAIQNALCDLSHSNFENLFESFFGDSFLAPARIFNQMPAVDIQETENGYVLAMDLPGIDEKNIDVHVDGANLTIASRTASEEEKKPEETGQGAFLLRERKSSVFSRSFKLPENADPGAVNASFKNGVLNLEIRKRAEAQKRTIQINAA
ncbi:MAG: Hsp20/alpha crystallin family protein [Treponema sp.]|nr:Hsp20/alpha crystallin family protein [Treponema sp.]MCL2237141.1 Hsp20/alpha crystallin family protein [Treponema sp.]